MKNKLHTVRKTVEPTLETISVGNKTQTNDKKWRPLTLTHHHKWKRPSSSDDDNDAHMYVQLCTSIGWGS